jgi:OOP family OmpA-OmpF porin
VTSINLNSLALLFAMMGTSWLAHSAEITAPAFRTSSVAEPLGEVFNAPTKTSAGLTRLTLFRPPTQPETGATSIELNGHYLTSLQRGGFAQLCLIAPTSISLRSRVIYSGQPVQDYPHKAITLALKSGQSAYVRVTDVGEARTKFELLDFPEAQAQLLETRRQSHVFSRVPGVVACQEDEDTAMPTPHPLETITLGSDALFAFGKTDIDSIFPYGQADLDRLIKRLKQRYGHFEQIQIRILGHADPLGNKAANRRIAAQRAQTIRDYMVRGGIDPKRIVNEGRGDSQLLVRHCRAEVTAESITCNKPNRRVVVEVSVFVH